MVALAGLNFAVHMSVVHRDHTEVCIQNLSNQSLAEILNVGRTILLKSCDYTKYQTGVEHWRGETWVPREIYCESTYQSMPKEMTVRDV